MYKTICEGLYTDLMPKTSKLMKAGIPRDAFMIDEAPGRGSHVWWVLNVKEEYYTQAMKELGLLIGADEE